MSRIRNYTVIDLEMTGLSAKENKIIEIGAVKVRDSKIVDQYSTLVKSTQGIPEDVEKLTGITNEMILEGMDENLALAALIDFIDTDIIVGHNVRFDYSFIKQWAVNNKIALELKACDTLKLARRLLPGEQSKKLESLCQFFNIERNNAHRALDDTKETQILFELLLDENDRLNQPEVVPVQLVYKAKRQTPATKHQKEKLKELVEKYNITDTIDFDSLTRSQASRLQDNFYSTYGR